MGDVKHTFVNPQADGGDATVQRPSDWNAQHSIADGTAALPSLGPSSDASVGWFFPAAETAALSTNAVECMRVDVDGIISFTDPADTVRDTVVWDFTRRFRVNTETTTAGTAVVGSANEFGTTLQFNNGVTGAAASYEKGALFVTAYNADPTTDPVNNFHDVVGIDTRSTIEVAPGDLGRAWGLVTAGIIPPGGYDGNTYGIEVDIYQNGTDQASLDTTTSKYGITIDSLGPNDSTAALYIVAAGSNFHYGVVMRDTSISTGGTFLELVGKFTVDKLGNIVTTGSITGSASTTARASLRLPHGSAPTSPVNGDIWTTTAGLFARINGVTVGPYT